MRVACPACAAAYEIPDELIAGGPRLLQCAACGAQFEAVAPVPPGHAEPAPPAAPQSPAPPPAARELEPNPEPTSSPEARHAPETDRPPPTRGPSRPFPAETLAPGPAPRPRGLAAAWLLSFAVLGLAAWSALHWRAEVVQAWPPAARLYAVLGLG